MNPPGKRNKTWDCAVYASAALEDYAGFSKPNDMLERLAKELLSDEPKKKARMGDLQARAEAADDR
jgi:phage terminase large subunit GpA-like protein